MLRSQIPNEGPIALDKLRELYKLLPSPVLKQYLDELKNPKSRTLENFIIGIKEFARFANAAASERERIFGNKFCGLHYLNNLAKTWNEASKTKTETIHFDSLAPEEWHYQSRDGFMIILYKGKNPARGLDVLLQGPTVIDCGMFCQLGIFFGIRYLLGDEHFNQVCKNLFITQVVNFKAADPNKPHTGNPLFDFFTSTFIPGSVAITQVFNHPLYYYKHPAGADGLYNALYLNGKYTVFNSTLARTSDLQKAEIEKDLWRQFNLPQDSADQELLTKFARAPKTMHPKFGWTFEEIIKQARHFKDLSLTENQWRKDIKETDSEEPLKLYFDLKKFLSFVDEQLLEAKNKIQLNLHTQAPATGWLSSPATNNVYGAFAKPTNTVKVLKDNKHFSDEQCNNVVEYTNPSTAISPK